MALRYPQIIVPIFAKRGNKRHESYSRDMLRAGCLGLVEMNKVWLNYYPSTPKIYDAGVRYVPEDGTEEWATIPSVIDRGFGDCEDLASWRAAELQFQGISAFPDILTKRLPNGSYRAHVIVKYADGKTEDPSAKLGMYEYGLGKGY
jgi:hypothetical protein